MARVLGLLPFFVLGLKATPERLERLRAPWVRNAALLVFLAIAVVATWTDAAGQHRVALLPLAVRRARTVGDGPALLIRARAPRGGERRRLRVPLPRPALERMVHPDGRATLVVYLFHGFVVKGAEYAGFPGWAAEHASISLVVTTLAAAGLALLLAWPPVAKVLIHVVDPFGTAEKHVKEAVQLSAAPARADQIAVAVEEAVAEEAVAAR